MHYERSHFTKEGKKELILIGLFMFALVVLIFLWISYKIIFIVNGIIIIYIFSVYLFLFLDHSQKETKLPTLKSWPEVSIIIPSFNSSQTIFKCLEACKSLNYPKNFEIIVVDDGSQDGSYEKLKEVKGIKLLKNPRNLGKAAALNHGIKNAKGEIIVCVDSDSYPEKDTLIKTIPYFYCEEKVGSVVVFIKVAEPKTLIQKMQEIEYNLSFGFFFKIIAFIDCLYVTPGPTSLYHKKVFEEIGYFAEDNITEDMEIALRIQKNGWKIKRASDAIAYTEVPADLIGLFKQRLRWFRGAIYNLLTYFDMFFNPRYKTLGLFILPLVLFSGFFTAIFFFWAILNYFDLFWKFALPTFLYSPILFFQSLALYFLDIRLVNSSFLLGFFGFLFWLFFCLKSFELANEKLKTYHIPGFVLMLFFYPVFIGFSFFVSYLMEFSGQRYRW
ncbi:MAG: glycosyltransferase family 2 protein [Candidatus Micrarchaeota archaeon]|nr:glycosyltransferase family 2 protein [Candidatus Micrarchaeota archaeon]